MANVVDKIMEKKYDKTTKIIRLWMITQLYYRQIIGDKAWVAINSLTDISEALSYLTGFAMGMGSSPKSIQQRLKDLVPELEELNKEGKNEGRI